MADINLSPEAFAKSAVQFKKELMIMIGLGLERSAQHMTVRTGIQYKQGVGQLAGSAEFGPYDSNRKSGETNITGREIEVFLGSVIKTFDPNLIYQSIYGSLDLNGDALKGVPVTKAILAAEMISLSKKLNLALFGAKRNAAGTTSKDLFNGFDEIAKAEITAGAIAAEKGNYKALTEAITSSNAVDVLKAIYRSASDELKEGETVKMFLPTTIKEMYEDDYQATVGATPYNKEFKKTILEGSDGRCELVALASKKDSKYIQITTKENMIIGTGNGTDHEKLNVDRFSPFELTLSSAMLFGCQYDTISPEKLLIAKLYEPA